MFAIAMKDEKTLFTYSYSRKVKLLHFDLLRSTCSASIAEHLRSAIVDTDHFSRVYSWLGQCHSSVSTSNKSELPIVIVPFTSFVRVLACIAFGVDTSNIGVLDMSSPSSPSLSFLWQSIPADVCRLAWHPIREGRVAYSTRLGQVALYDTLTARSRVVYDRKYNQPGSPTNVLWGPLVPSTAEDRTLAILYSVGDGKFHRWDSPEKNCLPTDLTALVNEVSLSVKKERRTLSWSNCSSPGPW